MTLKEYLNLLQTAMTEFTAYWEKHSEIDPVNFPDTMKPADWDEQFTMFAGKLDSLDRYRERDRD